MSFASQNDKTMYIQNFPPKHHAIPWLFRRSITKIQKISLLIGITTMPFLMSASCERKNAVTPVTDCLPNAVKAQLENETGVMHLKDSPRAPETTWYITRNDPKSLPLVICGDTPKKLQVEDLTIIFSGETQIPSSSDRGAFGYVKLNKFNK
jgi:hypothetical protein